MTQDIKQIVNSSLYEYANYIDNRELTRAERTRESLIEELSLREEKLVKLIHLLADTFEYGSASRDDRIALGYINATLKELGLEE